MDKSLQVIIPDFMGISSASSSMLTSCGDTQEVLEKKKLDERLKYNGQIIFS
jgi:hypothetical protein